LDSLRCEDDVLLAGRFFDLVGSHAVAQDVILVRVVPIEAEPIDRSRLEYIHLLYMRQTYGLGGLPYSNHLRKTGRECNWSTWSGAEFPAKPSRRNLPARASLSCCVPMGPHFNTGCNFRPSWATR